MRKTILYKMLALLAVILSAMPMETYAQFSGSGQGTQSDPYLIFNPLQLNQVRNYTGQSDVYFSLQSDIDLTQWLANNSPTLGWNPIGTASQPFSGKFLGNGHKITGLKINRPNASYVGFFGYLDFAEISNIEIEGEVTGLSYVALFCGSDTGSVMKNITCRGKISALEGTAGLFCAYSKSAPNTSIKCYGEIYAAGNNIGGLYGECVAIDLDLDKSEFKGKIKGSSNLGGIAGLIQSTYSGCNFSDCYSEVDITADGGSIGGLIGGITSSGLEIKNCGVSGMIRGESSNVQYVGGLLGKASAKTTISSCFVVADLDSPSADYMGGIVGKGISEIYDSYFSGSIKGRDKIGGIIGDIGNSGTACNISRTYSSASISGREYVGGILGHSSASYNAYLKVTSNFALNSSVSASQGNVGRIAPADCGPIELGELGSTNTNYSMVETRCAVNGAEHPYDGSLYEGDQSSMSTMKLRATYLGLGWDFNNEWAIQETEAFPYKKTQCVPPVIQSQPVSGSILIAGKSISGGKVYVEYDGEKYMAEVSGNNWTLRTEPMKAGLPIIAHVEAEGLYPSTKVVSYVGYQGSGTAEDPWQIYTVSDLANLNGKGYYKLMNDLDLKDVNWVPVGKNGATFTQFDGDGHTIKGLNINNPSENYCGLFSSLSDAKVINLTISGANVKGCDHTGVLAGSVSGCTINEVILSNCDVNGNGNVGGFVGIANNTTIELSLFNGNVTSENGQGGYTGGIVGQLSGSSTVKRCCSSGTVINNNASDGTNYAMGAGIAAYCSANSTIEDCFSIAEITANGYAAGICALNSGAVRCTYASGNLKSNTLAAGIVTYNDGVSATVTSSVAANPQIRIASQTGNAMRVIAGVRNGAAIPELGKNLALDNMVISVNDIPQEIYDDPMNGVATVGESLSKSKTYQDLGWNMTQTWSTQGGAMPVLKGLESVDGAARRDNYMYVTAVETAADNTFLLSVNLKNPTKAYTAQFDIQFPEGFSVVSLYDEDEEDDVLQVKKGDRIPRASSLMTKYQNNVLRVVIAGRETSYFTGDDGEIANILVKVDPAVVNGMYALPCFNGHLGIDGFVDVALSKFSAQVRVLNDYITATDVDVMAATNADMTINMTNKSSINAFQFDMTLPDGITIAQNAVGKPDIRLGSRCASGYGIETKEMADGSTRIVAIGEKALPGNEGEVLVIGLHADAGMKTSELTAKLRNIYLANTDFRSVECRDVDVQVKVTPYLRKGDVNVDALITAIDVIGTQAIQSNRAPENLSFYAADIDDNGLINTLDISGVRNMVLNEDLGAMRVKRAKAVSSEYIKDPTIDFYAVPFRMERGVETDIDICLDIPDYRVNVLAATLSLPEGFSFTVNPDDSLGAYFENLDRCPDDWNTMTTLQGSNSVKFNGVSFSKKLLKRRAGAFLRFKITADKDLAPGVYVGEISNIEVVNGEEESYTNDSQKFSIIVGNLTEVEHLPLAGQFKDEATVALFSDMLNNNSSLLSVDLTGLESWHVGSSLESVNPNTLKFVGAEPVVEITGNNIVKDGVCNELVLTDGHPFGTPVDFIAKSATFTHKGTAEGKSSTLYLPFTVTDYPAGAQFYNVLGYNDKEKELIIEYAEPTALTPLYVTHDSQMVLSATDAHVLPDMAEAVADVNGVGKMTGSLKHRPAETVLYDLSGGVPTKATALVPFRAYADEALINNQGTGVDIPVIDFNDDEVEIFTVSGIRLNCRVKDLIPGLYIINGQKVRIK